MIFASNIMNNTMGKERKKESKKGGGNYTKFEFLMVTQKELYLQI
jgi:hypothetical protein